MKTLYSIIGCCLFFLVTLHGAPTIHFFGDSHASHCFTNQKPQYHEQSTYRYNMGSGIIPVSFDIHWFDAMTMFRVGRDGLEAVNVRSEGMQEEDIAVFVFGEVDVRCHLGKQRDIQQRPIEDVIEDCVRNYIHTILKNRDQYNHIYCVVCSPIPPAPNNNHNFNPIFPMYGTIEDRIMINNKMRAILLRYCMQYDIGYFDFCDLFSTPKGDLDFSRSDGIVHINFAINGCIKDRLIGFLIQNNISFL